MADISNQNCKVKNQLTDMGVIVDKWAYNPISTYKPNRKMLKMYMQDLDGMQYANRFKWIYISDSIPKQLIEQMMYFRTTLAMFKKGKEFFLLPYVAQGDINAYAFMSKIQPIAFNGGAFDPKKVVNIGDSIDVNLYDERDPNKAVILYDRYNCFISNGGQQSKFALQDIPINEIVNRLSMLNVNLVNSQGKNIIIVKDPKQKEAIERALSSVYESDKSHAIVKGMFEVQVINNEIEYQEQQLWEDIQSWNNLRLEGLGITNNGLFNKKEREITIESTSDGEQVEIVSDSYFEARKDFCKRVNETFGNDPDFIEQFGKFDVIDLRLEKEKNRDKNMQNDSKYKEDDEDDSEPYAII